MCFWDEYNSCKAFAETLVHHITRGFTNCDNYDLCLKALQKLFPSRKTTKFSHYIFTYKMSCCNFEEVKRFNSTSRCS